MGIHRVRMERLTTLIIHRKEDYMNEKDFLKILDSIQKELHEIKEIMKSDAEHKNKKASLSHRIDKQ